MNCKLNIIEPWEFGTVKAVDAIVKEPVGKTFLLELRVPMRFNRKEFDIFLCEFVNEEDRKAFNMKNLSSYIINMVFDNNLSKNGILRPLKSYRSNFLLGELSIDPH